MPANSSSPAPASPVFRKLNVFELDERNKKILQWHYVHSWPVRIIQLMLVRESDEVRAKGGIPDKPLTLDGVYKVIDRHLRKEDKLDILDARGAGIQAKMRYEHLFQICLGILKRQPKPATYNASGKRLTRELPPLTDQAVVSLVRAAASCQGMLDRVSGVTDPRELLQMLEEQDAEGGMNPLAVCQSLVKLFPGQSETQERIRGIFSDVVRGRLKATERAGDSPARKSASTRRRSPRRG